MRARRLRAVPVTDGGPSLRDEAGVAAAVAAHGPELFRFALRGLGDAGAAQDVVQETFLRAWRSAERFDPSVASLRVWLFAIARNAVIDAARAAAVRPWDATVAEPPADAAYGTVADPTDHLVDTWFLEEALLRLSEEHRSAIVETHLRQRPYEEVAAEQHIPVGTLRSRVFYGLKSLRVVMEEIGVTT